MIYTVEQLKDKIPRDRRISTTNPNIITDIDANLESIRKVGAKLIFILVDKGVDPSSGRRTFKLETFLGFVSENGEILFDDSKENRDRSICEKRGITLDQLKKERILQKIK